MKFMLLMTLRAASFGLTIGLALSSTKAIAQQKRNPVIAVQKQDKDGDGRVSRGEWRRPPSAFNRIDTNKDGYITVEEYAAFFGAQNSGSHMKQARVNAATSVRIPIGGGRELNGTLFPAAGGRTGSGIIILHTAFMRVEPGDIAFAKQMSKQGFTALTLNFIHKSHQPRIWNPGITSDLMKVSAWLAGRPEVGGKPIAAMGFSLGAHALLLAARDPSIKAVVVYYGAYDPAKLVRIKLPSSVPVPLKVANRVRVPVLLLHGDADDEVPVSQAVQMKQRLQAAGTKVELVRYPGAYHRFDRGPTPTMHGNRNRSGHFYQINEAARSDAVKRSVDWFKKYLGI